MSRLHMLQTGLPDGVFSNQNHNFCIFWKALQGKMLIYFRDILSSLHTANWYIFCPFGIFCGNSVHFPHFNMFYQEKSGNPGFRPACRPVPFLAHPDVHVRVALQPRQPDHLRPTERGLQAGMDVVITISAFYPIFLHFLD
jgi:hypothetical protein